MFFFILVAASVGGSIGVFLNSTNAIKRQKERLEAIRPSAEQAVKISNEADTILSDTKTVALLKNTALAKAMVAHNTAYPDVYDKVSSWIPKFFRVTSMVATPSDDKTVTVTLTGLISSYQRYSDLMLALLRSKDVLNVSRSGFAGVDTIVPNLSEVDQTGRPHKSNVGAIPDDPLDRLSYFQSQSVSPSGYLGVGGFGSGAAGYRGSTPDESQITVVLTVSGPNLMVPVPRTTLTSGGGANTASAGGFGFPGGGPTGGPGGPRGGPSAGKSRGETD